MSLENVIQFVAKKRNADVPTHASQPKVTPSPTAPPLSLSDSGGHHAKTGLKYNGFIPMRCSFFAPEFLCALPPGEVVLFLYLTFLSWRYPTKEGFVRASVSYLVEGTGLGRTAIQSYLNHLESLKLIVCLDVNYKAGNVYRIQDLLIWKGEPESEKKTKKEQSDSSELAEIRTGADRKTDRSCLDSEQEVTEKRSEDYTSLSSSTLSYSLSGEPIESVKKPDPLEDYFASVKPEEKKKGEQRHFGILQKDFSLPEIAGALDYIQGKGLPGSGERCHSPMAYLSKAMNEVLGIVKAEAGKSAKAKEDRSTSQDRKQAEQAQREAEDREHEIKARNFEKAFPSLESQQEYLRKIQRRFPMFDLDGPGLRSMAIQALHSEGSGQAGY